MKLICKVLAAGILGAAASLAWAQTAVPAVAASPQAGRELVSMCTGCHSIPGYQASFPRVFRVPKIGGQPAKYIENALTAYRRGERSHPTMHAIAKGLSDTEITLVAAYYAGRGAGN